MTSQAPSIKPYCNQEALDKFFWELEAKLPNPQLTGRRQLSHVSGVKY